MAKKPGPKKRPPAPGVGEIVNTGAGERFRVVRWSISQAAVEFSIDKGALTKRLKALAIEPDEGSRFSTMQICAAKFGDLDMERTRKISEDADGSALANAQTRKKLGEVRLFFLFLQEVGATIRQHIVASSMPDQEQKDLLEELAVLTDHGELTRRVCPD